MPNKKLQEQRMKNYFRTAAMEIIKAEGIEAASARTIAERAGYSYATIYNYYKDIKDLLSEALLMFYEECREYIHLKSEGGPISAKKLVKFYTEYFIQYPSVFFLLFAGIKNLQHNSFEILFSDIIQKYTEIDTSKKDFRINMYALHGFLLSALRREQEKSVTQIFSEIEELCF